MTPRGGTSSAWWWTRGTDHVNPDTLSSGWRHVLKQAGFPHVRFHDLRHAHATLMLLKGIHPKVVSAKALRLDVAMAARRLD